MKQKKYFIIYGLCLSILVLFVGGFYVYKTINDSSDIDKTAVKKDAYYSIRNNATSLQKTLYEDLINSLESDVKDDKNTYELLAQNYVADFYTWTNKFRRNDVGGIQFVDEDIRTNVYQAAQNQTYNDLYYYLENGGLKNTLEVSEVTVTDSKYIDYFIIDSEGEEEIYDEVIERYVYGDYHDAYAVSLRWTYKETESFNTNVYEKDAQVIMMMNKDNIPMIVEVNHEKTH